jgi:hypothetical protein
MIRGIYSYPNKRLRNALRIWFKNLGLEKSMAGKLIYESGDMFSDTERLRNIPLERLVQLSNSILELVEKNQIPDPRRGVP